MGNEDQKQLEKALANNPKGLPFYLDALTTAGHLLAAGYSVQEQTDSALLPGQCLIFAPVLLAEGGYINAMFEVRLNLLFTLQQAADECGVSYRTIQRWRDEKKIVCLEIDGKQLIPSGILREAVAKMRHGF